MKSRIGELVSSTSLLACLACGEPADDPLMERELALESAQCSLGAECENWGVLRVDQPLPPTTCTASAALAVAPLWVQPLTGASCPFGRCVLYDQQLSLDADGSLVTLAAVQLPSQYGAGGNEGGLWFTRHSSDGELLRDKLLDFSAPPPGIEIARHGALLRDGWGRTRFASSRDVRPFNAPRPLHVSGLSRSLNAGGPLFSTQPGWGVSAAALPNEEWVVASHRPLVQGRSRASVARHDRRGRALWNRTWPESSAVRALLATREQAIFALVSETTSDAQLLYRLDKHGVVAWRRMVGAAHDLIQVVATNDGSLFLAWLEESGFNSNVRIEQLTGDGQRAAAWLIPQVMFPVPALASDAAGGALLALPGYDGQRLPVLHWYALDGAACQHSSYQWPSDSSAVLDPVAVQSDHHGARFFASSQMIGQLRAGGAP